MKSRYVNKNGLVFDNETGKKMYPVGMWRTNSHVFYNYNDICYNEYMENPADKTESKFDQSQVILGLFEHNPQINGVVYAYYEDYRKMRDIIEAYRYRHAGKL